MHSDTTSALFIEDLHSDYSIESAAGAIVIIVEAHSLTTHERGILRQLG
jgi:hypothetical protein